MKYTLPYPKLENRKPIKRDWVRRGDVYAFEYNGRRGVVVMESNQSFYAAANLYDEERYVWVHDELPDEIELYGSSFDEQIWGYQCIVEDYHAFSLPEENPLISFIENACPNKPACEDNHLWELCFDILSVVPWFDFIQKWNDTIKTIWKAVDKQLKDTGLQYNARKTELYCYLMGVLMIVDYYNRNIVSRLDFVPYTRERIQEFRANWKHFSWMYGMVLGRLVGTDFNTFTALVNGLSTSWRRPYLHLYLPLIESNIDKICRYSNIEKRDKLVKAIEKARHGEALNEQAIDLDKLYSIVFPSYFRQQMSENRPASSIKEMKEELAKKDKQIEHWKGTAEQLTLQINELTSSMEERIKESLSMEDVSTAILAMKTDIGKLVFSNLDYKLRKNEVWRNGRDELLDKLEEKEEQEMRSQHPTMNDNNGIVAGGNVSAELHLTNEQVQMFIKELSLNQEQSRRLEELKK